MAPIHVMACDLRRVNPLWVSRHDLPPKSTMEIYPSHRTVPIKLGFDKRYLFAGFIGMGHLQHNAAAELSHLSHKLLCNCSGVYFAAQVMIPLKSICVLTTVSSVTCWIIWNPYSNCGRLSVMRVMYRPSTAPPTECRRIWVVWRNLQVCLYWPFPGY